MKPAPPVIKTRSATTAPFAKPSLLNVVHAPFATPSLLNVVRPELFRHLAKSELLRSVEPKSVR
jgi:hypothetical protein